MNTQELDHLFGKRTIEAQLESDKSALMFGFLSIIDGLMAEKKMTKKALATEIGTSAAYITQLFRGNKTINLETIVKMQTALGIRFEIRVKGAKVLSNKNECDFINDAVDELENTEEVFPWGVGLGTSSDCNLTVVA